MNNEHRFYHSNGKRGGLDIAIVEKPAYDVRELRDRVNHLASLTNRDYMGDFWNMANEIGATGAALLALVNAEINHIENPSSDAALLNFGPEPVDQDADILTGNGLRVW